MNNQKKLSQYRHQFIFNLCYLLYQVYYSQKKKYQIDINSSAQNLFNNLITQKLLFTVEQLDLLNRQYQILNKLVPSHKKKQGFKRQLFIQQGDMINYCYENNKFNWKIAILNMANAIHPGGGFLNGARAQEEVLCNRSSLFPGLLLAKSKGYYPIPTGHSLVINNGIQILLDSNFQPLDYPNNNLVVISTAAKNYQSEQDALNDPNLNNIIYNNWLSIIYAANLAKVDELVISALGAGAFQNPPEYVGSQLIHALHDCCPGNLKKISLVILDDHNGKRGKGNYLRMIQGIKEANQQNLSKKISLKIN